MCISGIFIGVSAIYSNTGQNHQNYMNSLETSPQNASTIIIGTSYIKVPQNAKVVTQVDRVVKDKSSNINDNTPPGQIPTSAKQLVPYMEGARVAESHEICRSTSHTNYRSHN